MSDSARAAADRVRALAPDRRPGAAVVLGSGLGAVADAVTDAVAIPYADLPGFPIGEVDGHAGRMVLGRLGGVAVACMQGRVHLYEGAGTEAVRTFVRTLARLGCGTMIATNAAGAIRPDMAPGALMMVTDHINMMGLDPLVGRNDDAYGPRFPSLVDAYDPALRERLLGAAARLGIALHEGVYAGWPGPAFETPAEIRALARLGADAVGMSLVPEAIVARHAGLRVAALSVITNAAAGLAAEGPDHARTLAESGRAAATLARLLVAFFEDLARDGAG